MAKRFFLQHFSFLNTLTSSSPQETMFFFKRNAKQHPFFLHPNSGKTMFIGSAYTLWRCKGYAFDNTFFKNSCQRLCEATIHSGFEIKAPQRKPQRNVNCDQIVRGNSRYSTKRLLYSQRLKKREVDRETEKSVVQSHSDWHLENDTDSHRHARRHTLGNSWCLG